MDACLEDVAAQRFQPNSKECVLPAKAGVGGIERVFLNFEPSCANYNSNYDAWMIM